MRIRLLEQWKNHPEKRGGFLCRGKLLTKAKVGVTIAWILKTYVVWGIVCWAGKLSPIQGAFFLENPNRRVIENLNTFLRPIVVDGEAKQ